MGRQFSLIVSGRFNFHKVVLGMLMLTLLSLYLSWSAPYNVPTFTYVQTHSQSSFERLELVAMQKLMRS